MKKRFLCLLLGFIMLLSVSAYAVTPRATLINSDIAFDGTEATCTANIFGSKATDEITATMQLRRSGVLIDTWSGSGTGTPRLVGTAEVALGKTYALIVNATINGVAQTPVTISETNN